MKIISVAILAVVLAAICTAIGWRIFSRRSTEATETLAVGIPGKVAIVYFSESPVGNTATAAKWIQKHTGGDLVPIEAVEPYPASYNETLKRARAEREAGVRVPVKPVPSLAGYDIVFIGSPIWYGTYAWPVATFLDSEKLAGKRVVPFCTHGGGGAGTFLADLKDACRNADFLPLLSLRGSNQVERRLGTGITVHHTENDVVRHLNAIFK